MMRSGTVLGAVMVLAACGKPSASDPAAGTTFAASDVSFPASSPPPPPPPPPPSAPASFLPAEFRALGTEPFWSAIVVPGKLVWSSPDDEQATTIPVERSDGLAKVRLTGKLKGAALALEITQKPCSDGMSDRVYPFTAALTIGAEARQGCAISQDQLEREPKP